MKITCLATITAVILGTITFSTSFATGNCGVCTWAGWQDLGGGMYVPGKFTATSLCWTDGKWYRIDADTHFQVPPDMQCPAPSDMIHGGTLTDYCNEASDGKGTLSITHTTKTCGE